jgi:hypothetical protein
MRGKKGGRKVANIRTTEGKTRSERGYNNSKGLREIQYQCSKQSNQGKSSQRYGRRGS